jgi:hypothetical protein
MMQIQVNLMAPVYRKISYVESVMLVTQWFMSTSYVDADLSSEMYSEWDLFSSVIYYGSRYTFKTMEEQIRQLYL